ncbi:MAG: hypothetical protein FWH32_03695 [Clostridiales bacterium]|nr:hypothetical protein [Clostridiales bacterium]
MTRKLNRLARCRNNPNAVSFEELKMLLESFGFEVKNYSGGSHFSVSHSRYDVINAMEPNAIPMKKPHILPVYVRRAIRWIEKVIEMQEGGEAANDNASKDQID